MPFPLKFENNFKLSRSTRTPHFETQCLRRQSILLQKEKGKRCVGFVTSVNIPLVNSNFKGYIKAHETRPDVT